MDSLIAAIIGVTFGSIGAGVIWLFNKRKIPYNEILKKNKILNDVIGLIILVLVGIIIYLVKNRG
ncbi:MAG: hypothetical protein HOP07_04165 [Bacteriovoracaceae bacterium]|nr:hypothetical protein [Bacteriovoracaceae bacterium]